MPAQGELWYQFCGAGATHLLPAAREPPGINTPAQRSPYLQLCCGAVNNPACCDLPSCVRSLACTVASRRTSSEAADRAGQQDQLVRSDRSADETRPGA